MKDESNEILSDLLAQWHRWANGYKYAGGINSSPMFRECRSNHRQWASLDEVADEDKSQWEHMDAVIMSLCDVYRTALQLNARNLATGRSVWTSARLPTDAVMRARVLADARTALCIKLRVDGVL
jgi:hypothetical protein